MTVISDKTNDKNTEVRQGAAMARILKYLFFLLVICAVGVAGYALVFDLPAPQSEVVKPVEIDLG